jgi:hypothetical protein
MYVVVFWRSTTVGEDSVVVVVVELVTGAGATTTAGAGTVSTTGAGVVVSSTVRWYEKHPLTIPHAAIAAGIIARRLIDRMFGNLHRVHILRAARSWPDRDFVEFILVCGVDDAVVVRKSFRVADLTLWYFG